MSFSQRIGIIPQKPIQIGTIEDSLRNRLYNTINRIFPQIPGYNSPYNWIRDYVLDKLGYNLEQTSATTFDGEFLSSEWFVVYDILEYVIEYLNDKITPEYRYNSDSRMFIDELKEVLEEEKSGYRLLNNQFVPITSTEELDSLEESLNIEYSSVATHMSKAIALYSDRKNPDYENSIKESISAVESLCCIITSSKGTQATLGNTIKKLKENGITIHPALEEAFNKIYGYTSDEDGIRHGSIDFKSAPAEDAKYMLVSCSAFINYLIEKLGKMKT